MSTSDQRDPAEGTCKVDVKGYFNKSFFGRAVYEDVPGLGGRTLFFLELADIIEPGIDYRCVEFSGGSKPNAGTYNLINVESNNNWTKGILVGWYNDSEVVGSFHSLGGTIVISCASDKVLKGWADFTAAANVAIGNGQSIRAEIRITAEFYAEEGETGIIVD